MQIVRAPRASAILYSLLVHQRDKNPWLLPASICPIVPITFLKARVPFQFVDISADSLHMDLEQAETLIRDRKFAGLLYAHTYGETSTPLHFFERVRQISPGLIVIDDRCLCIPDLEPDPANQADIQLYSTGYAKIVDLSFGGYAFVKDEINYRAAHAAFRLKDHEEIEKSYKAAVSQRTRFFYRDSDWLDASTPVPAWDTYRERIEKKLLQSLEQRITLNQIYASTLPVGIQLPGNYQTWRFNIRVQDKQHLLDRIFSAGLFASSHYASLAGIMDEGSAPHAEALAANVINLFNDHHFSTEQAEQVCRIILENLP
jgi:dTDP-4-amino-4,6-dideoxygalactose transaminase